MVSLTSSMDINRCAQRFAGFPTSGSSIRLDTTNGLDCIIGRSVRSKVLSRIFSNASGSGNKLVAALCNGRGKTDARFCR